MSNLRMKLTVVGLGMLALVFGSEGLAQPTLTVYEIQSNTIDGDASTYDGEIVNCIGGIVVSKFRGFRPRIILQDPTYPSAWGGIQVKDWVWRSDLQEWELYDHVEIGDWVSLTNVLVEEFVGNTMLQYQTANSPGFIVESQGNFPPESLLVTMGDLAYPPDRSVSEPYESVAVTLQRVVVGQMGLGKESDNYELMRGGHVAWGSDYMNVDAGAPYDPRIETGIHLLSVTGVLEQYTNTDSGWDYYQLCTRSAADIVLLPIPTVSTWGAAAMAILLLIGGTIALRWRLYRRA